jgi:hypothetical protein
MLEDPAMDVISKTGVEHSMPSIRQDVDVVHGIKIMITDYDLRGIQWFGVRNSSRFLLSRGSHAHLG